VSASLLAAADEVARLAGAVALRHFRSALTVERKPDGSPVTVADREAERVAREWLEARFPGDGIIGEELGDVRPEARRRWAIDPIDGTKTFVRGTPLWGTLVAAIEGDRVLAGAASFPAVDEHLAAAPGEGCWWNGRRCAVSATAALEKSCVLTTDEWFRARPDRRPGWERLAAGAEIARSWGDCYGYLLVATGRAEVMVDPVLSIWDSAALLPIVEEAGGVFTDWDGARTGFGGSAIATNAGVARAARRLLAGGAATNG